MRDIKFRVWNGNKNVWCNSFANVDLVADKLDYSENNYLIQQFIGKTDKNGKKIFEGDILKVKFLAPNGNSNKTEEQIGVIEYNDDCSCFELSLPEGKTYLWMEDIEIIGNVQEHPGICMDFMDYDKKVGV
jgi:uncharacterized phage protein (TIGR01671 family)